MRGTNKHSVDFVFEHVKAIDNVTATDHVTAFCGQREITAMPFL